MSSGRKYPLAKIKPFAQKLIDTLAPACERIELAGSIRRRKPMVGDVEIVLVSKQLESGTADMFTGEFQTTPAIDGAVNELASRDDFELKKNGELYKKLEYLFIMNKELHKIGIDIFIANSDNWGFIYALRTGSHEFNMQWAIRQLQGGQLPNEYRFRDGYLTEAMTGKRIATPTENDVFSKVGIDPPPPELRTGDYFDTT